MGRRRAGDILLDADFGGWHNLDDRFALNGDRLNVLDKNGLWLWELNDDGFATA